MILVHGKGPCRRDDGAVNLYHRRSHASARGVRVRHGGIVRNSLDGGGR